jgi:hypothetical protein
LSQLNYFLPSLTAKPTDENALTRAFMTTMRYSPALMFGFYQMVRDSLHAKGIPAKATPKVQQLNLADVVIDSQRRHLGKEVRTIVSVLLTNDDLVIKRTIEPIVRKPVYDGLLAFGNDIMLFIENKPRNKNVWEDQLCPSKEDVTEDTTVIGVPAIVSWRDIVDLINSLISSPAIGGSERTILSDLRAYMGQHHGHLNPYRTFGQCGNNNELLYLRIESLLKEVAKDPKLVDYHNGWAYYIMVEGYPGIEQVGLVLHEDKEGKWTVELFLAFADTIKQSRAFYTRDIRISRIDELRGKGWEVKGNFHLSHMQRHLYWYPTDADKLAEYVAHWKAHVPDIHRYPKGEVAGMLKKLFNQGLLSDNDEMRTGFKKYVLNTKRTRINMSPGVVLLYHWTAAKAVELDAKDQLRDEVITRIKEGFTILGMKPNFLSA